MATDADRVGLLVLALGRTGSDAELAERPAWDGRRSSLPLALPLSSPLFLRLAFVLVVIDDVGPELTAPDVVEPRTR